VGKPSRQVDLPFALHGGEDYELLFTSPRGQRIPARIAGIPIAQIGRITPRRKIFLINPAGIGYELEPRGWEHFRK
jgi:thiamine-monophosphate kinase